MSCILTLAREPPEASRLSFSPTRSGQQFRCGFILQYRTVWQLDVCGFARSGSVLRQMAFVRFIRTMIMV